MDAVDKTIGSSFVTSRSTGVQKLEPIHRAKTRLEKVTAEIQEKQTASANMGIFLNAFEQMPDALAEFSLESWHSMVDFATVYSIDDIRFTFKNGQEIQA